MITPEKWKKKLAIDDFFETFHKLYGSNILHVGSTGEGLAKPSATLKRDSDIDIMITDTKYVVIELKLETLFATVALFLNWKNPKIITQVMQI